MKSTMAQLNTKLVVMLLCGGLPLLVPARNITNITWDFLALFGGKFENAKQKQNGDTRVAHVHYKHVPVNIPALAPAPVIYDEWVVNGNVEQMLLFIVSEQAGPSVQLDIRSFTDPSLYEPNEFNVSSLRDLKKEDLRGSKCIGEYRRLARAVYIGGLPDCTQIFNGTRPIFANTFVCLRSSSISPPSTPTFAPSPYIFDRVGARYPPIGYPDTYDNICGRRSAPRNYREAAPIQRPVYSVRFP